MDNHSQLHLAVLFLGAAVIAVPLCRRLGLGSILGYLLVGALFGPSGLWVVKDSHELLKFSELGVVMLLFVIGLELKPNRLWVMRRSVFGLGTAQVFFTGLVFAIIGHFLGFSWVTSAVAGLGLSLSSTPFALQMLAEKGQLNTPHGRSAFSILLFQDIAVIPLLALVPMLGAQPGVESGPLLPSLLKSFAVIAGIVIGGRYVLPPMFRLVASSGIREVFIAATLLVVLGTALVMEIFGMSMALGTFLAGVLLAESEYRHELEADVEPFKGLFLGLFFMAVGMSVDLSLLFNNPVRILGATLLLMSVKYLVLYVLGRIGSCNSDSSLALASTLPQGGEFAFVLFNAATVATVMSAELTNNLILIVSLSMALTPMFVAVTERFFLRFRAKKAPPEYDKIPTASAPMVLIAGFGRVGQIVGRILRVKGIGFTALEHDSSQVEVIRRFGNQVYYGDASRLDLLEAAGAKNASAFVLAIEDVESSTRTAQVVKTHFPNLPIFARVRNRNHAFELMKLGVTPIFRETLGSSLEISEKLLVALGETAERARQTIQTFREHDEKTLEGQFKIADNEKELVKFSRQAAAQLTELFQADNKK